MYLSNEIVGLVAGWLADQVVRGAGLGLARVRQASLGRLGLETALVGRQPTSLWN
jgi:hypothetical protein